MAILGFFIRREITAFGSSKQVSRQLNRLFNGSLPYSAALLHSACLARGWIYVRLDALSLEKQEILVGATLASTQCKLPLPKLCALFLLPFPWQLLCLCCLNRQLFLRLPAQGWTWKPC